MSTQEENPIPLSEKQQLGSWSKSIERAIRSLEATLSEKPTLRAWAYTIAPLHSILNSILDKYGETYLTPEWNSHFVPFKEITLGTEFGEQLRIHAPLDPETQKIAEYAWTFEAQTARRDLTNVALGFPHLARFKDVDSLLPQFYFQRRTRKGTEYHFHVNAKDKDQFVAQFITEFLIMLRGLYSVLKKKQEDLS